MTLGKSSRRDFWINKDRWPWDSDGYMFLLNAVDPVGRMLFGETWKGDEPIAPFPFGRSIASRFDYLRYPARPSIKRDATDTADPKIESLMRFGAVQRAIRNFAVKGKLRTRLRPLIGEFGPVLDPSIWSLRNVANRFHFGLLDPGHPFGTEVNGEGFMLIFVNEGDLRELVQIKDLQTKHSARVQTLNSVPVSTSTPSKSHSHTKVCAWIVNKYSGKIQPNQNAVIAEAKREFAGITRTPVRLAIKDVSGKLGWSNKRGRR